MMNNIFDLNSILFEMIFERWQPQRALGHPQKTLHSEYGVNRTQEARPLDERVYHPPWTPVVARMVLAQVRGTKAVPREQSLPWAEDTSPTDASTAEHSSPLHASLMESSPT